MAGAAVLQGCAATPKCRRLKIRSARSIIHGGDANRALRPPPLHISTNPSDVNPNHLRDLYLRCNLSPHRFPNRDAAGRVEPPDGGKLRLALRHSAAVVSVFCRPEAVDSDWADLFRKVMPVRPDNGRLVGFGRAVSDHGLTASIHDVMVVPPLRKMGIGRTIVKRIISFTYCFPPPRILTSKDVYDIAALCSKEERSFFQACGFGDDILCSTTMMYARAPSSYASSSHTPSTYASSNHIVKRAGRKLLLAPFTDRPL